MQHHTRQQTVDFEVGANNIAVIPSQLELAVTNKILRLYGRTLECM